MNVRRTLTNQAYNLDDLKVWNAGARKKQVTRFGPVIRDHYFIFHLVEGHAVLHTGKKTFTLKPNQGFLIPPETLHYYEPEHAMPWSYFWFSFHGTKCEQLIRKIHLTYDNPIFAFEEQEQIFEQLNLLMKQNLLHFDRPCSEITKLRILGLLYIYFAQLIDSFPERVEQMERKKHSESYVKQAIQFIELNFHKKISITEVAEFVGLNASYLGQLFKEYAQLSPKQFLCQYRMEKAAQYMNNPNLTIREISQAVGYEDPYLFSRMFRKVKQTSPTAYRAKL